MYGISIFQWYVPQRFSLDALSCIWDSEGTRRIYASLNITLAIPVCVTLQINYSSMTLHGCKILRNKEDISKTSYIQRWQRLIVWSGISSFLIYLSRPMNLRAKSGLSLPVLFREIKPKKLDSPLLTHRTFFFEVCSPPKQGILV